MKFVMIIYQPEGQDPKALSEADRSAIAAEYAALSATPNIKSGLPFGFDRDAVTVRVQNGETVTTPGPNSKPPVGGYFEFEAETPEEAVALAARVPVASRGGAVEVRLSQRYW